MMPSLCKIEEAEYAKKCLLQVLESSSVPVLLLLHHTWISRCLLSINGFISSASLIMAFMFSTNNLLNANTHHSFLKVSILTSIVNIRLHRITISGRFETLTACEVIADSGGSVLVSCGWKFVLCATLYRQCG